MNGKNGVDRLGRSVAASLALVAALGIWLRAGVAGAQTACPPPPDPVPGLSGGPKFLGGATDQFADKVDDPRWNGAYRDDYPDASETEVGVRMLKEGDGLFVSFDVKRDPNGAAVNADAVYVGFAKAGDANGVIAKISFTNPPSPATLVPATNTGDVIQVAFWKTADGGGHWTSTPASWASPTNVHAWTGSGTGTGSSWVISGRFSLAALATALGVSSTLAAPFQMWFDVDVSTGEGPIPYTWPAAVPYGTTSTPDVAVSSFGTVSTSCPSGVTIDPMHIGVMPLGPAGTPSTQPDVRPGQPPVDWIAQLITVGVPTPPNGNVEARFRIANWGSIGSGAT
jgi:hypothetical protein